MRQQTGVAPANAADAATKAYVDAAVAAALATPRPYTAPSGYWQMPIHMMGTGSQQALTSGNCNFIPFDVGPQSMTYQALGVNVGTAQSGGTVTFSVAIYHDDGTGGMPQTAGGPIASGTIALTTSGAARSVAVSGTLTPGRYWLAALYVVNSTPTTAPLVMCVSNSINLPAANGIGIGNTIRSWVLTGAPTLPSTDQRSNMAGASSAVPCVGVRAA